MKFHRLLSTGDNNKVIVLNETEVAKLFSADTRSSIGSEAKKMQYANTINNLIGNLCRLDYKETLQADMLVMERVFHMYYRAYEVEKRELWLEVFWDKIRQLHNGGFVQKHINKTPDLTGFTFINILHTDHGLRLVDEDIYAKEHEVNDTIFIKYPEAEYAALK